MYVFVSFPEKKVTLLKCRSSVHEDQANGITGFPAIAGSNFEICDLNFSNHCITKQKWQFAAQVELKWYDWIFTTRKKKDLHAEHKKPSLLL